MYITNSKTNHLLEENGVGGECHIETKSEYTITRAC